MTTSTPPFPPHEYKVDYATATSLWPHLDLPETTENGTPMHWRIIVGGPLLTHAQNKALGKRPSTRARNYLKHSTDLYIAGMVGGSRVVFHRIATEPGWRKGLFGHVPEEVHEIITRSLTP